MISFRRFVIPHGYPTALAAHPGFFRRTRSTSPAAGGARPGIVADRGAGARPGGALSDAAYRPAAGAPAGAALGQRSAAEQGFPSPGANHAVAGDPVRPAPGAGTEQERPDLLRQCRAGLYLPVPGTGHERPAECPAGYLCPHRTRPHALDQGLCATGEDGAVRVRRHRYRRHADRPFAAIAAVGPGCHVSGDPVGLQGHPAVLRRQRAVDQQRHAAGRRLDRDAPGRCRR